MTDENLLFLISPPRSGSSFLQQILLSNSKIISNPESWLLLPFFYARKTKGITADYNQEYAVINIREYLSKISDGEKVWKDNLKKFVFSLYQPVFEKGEQVSYYLEKTPRYYHIGHELMEFFPNSKFILLLRNPLSVFASILDYNFNGDITAFKRKDRLDDIFKSFELLEKNVLIQKKNVIVVSYENIVSSPANEVKAIFEFLGLSFSGINYSLNEDFINSQGRDTKSLQKYNHPVKELKDSWKKSINTSQKKKVAEDYIHMLGEKRFENLGYSFHQTLSDLKDHKVESESLLNYSFQDLLKDSYKYKFIRKIYGRKNH